MEALAEQLYAVPQEHLDFRATIRQLCRERVAPRAAEIDARAEYPHDVRALLAEHDVLGLPFEVEHGGTGTGALMLNMAVEEIAKVCASSALILMIQELGTLPIKLFGTDDQQRRWLPRCASGEWSPAFALSEPEAGSDPGGMLTRARRDGDEWVIAGTKNWITNLGIADFYVVFAVTDPDAGHSHGISCFVVEADRPGFSVGKLEHKLGIRGSPTGQPIFDDVRVPAANLIGTEGEGFKVAMASPGWRWGSPRARPTTPPRTRASAASSASRSPPSRRSSSSSPTWRPSARRAASCSTRRARRPTAASPTWASTPRWPSSSIPTWPCR
jgi:alkylation response protein AidB-like acyl-CoA dehydrogenase